MRGEGATPFGVAGKRNNCPDEPWRRILRLEWRLAERGRLLALESERRAAAEAALGATRQQNLELLYALGQIQSSNSWRITAPLRALGLCRRALVDFLRPPRRHAFRLAPNADIVEHSGYYVCTGADPQLCLLPVDGRLPHGWTVFRYRVGRAGTALLPRLYADLGWGYAEANSWPLAPACKGEATRAIHLPATPVALRLDLG